ncbi:MAG: response regulator, partial [Alistipes sp.]|nr:response regulator [Alistipes sp.]
MKALIIEDEFLPAKRLEKLLRELRPGVEICGLLQTVDESVEWFRRNGLPDIVFVDIHLADGISFSIFEEIEVRCPVVFTTAYDQYALRAFEVNSVDYLLKPIHKEDLERALGKWELLKQGGGPFPWDDIDVKELTRVLSEGTRSYKNSFLVAHKDTLIPVQVKEIAYFFLENKIVTAFSWDGRRYNLDTTLEVLARRLDPAL